LSINLLPQYLVKKERLQKTKKVSHFVVSCAFSFLKYSPSCQMLLPPLLLLLLHHAGT
jgi:hypothetical protein